MNGLRELRADIGAVRLGESSAGSGAQPKSLMSQCQSLSKTIASGSVGAKPVGSSA